MNFLCIIFLVFQYIRADTHLYMQSNNLNNDREGNIPIECFDILELYAEYISNFTLCSILHARPIRLCQKCVDNYVQFHEKYQELLHTVVNETSCGSLFMSQDRLNVVKQQHDSILNVWSKGNCHSCFDWAGNIPTLKNKTIEFYKKFNVTMNCIVDNIQPGNNVCEKCMDSYLQLDDFYKGLSVDSIGVDSVCMDIVDSMNSTRSIWSKTLNCCKLRQTPEIVFLSCAGIISILPLFYYLTVRYCGPIKDLPNVLKQSRFKQTILRTIERRSD